MDRYKARINLYGSTQRERLLNRQKKLLSNKLPNSLSYKDILLNGEPSQLIINSGTQPYYKEFESLPGQDINIGDYVEWANSHWLVVTCDYDDELYKDGKLNQCNWLLKWQNEDGRIIERWAVVSSSSGNDGIDDDKTLTLGADQLSVCIPVDEESVKIAKSEKKKFFIDNNTTNPTTYELTNPRNVINTFNGHGVTSWIVKECAYTPTKEELETGVCGYIAAKTIQGSSDTSNSTPNAACYGAITYKGSKSLVAGGNAKTFSFEPTDQSGNPIDTAFTWHWYIADPFQELLSVTITPENKCKIKVEYGDLIVGETLKLMVTDENNAEIISENIEIGGGL